MKKSVYYILLSALWVAAVVVLAILLLFFGVFPMNFGLGYSLGGACGHPQLWMIATSFVLLLRPIVWKLVTKESKQFKKSTAIIILVIGIVWLSMNVGARILNNYANEKLIEQYEG